MRLRSKVPESFSFEVFDAKGSPVPKTGWEKKEAKYKYRKLTTSINFSS